MMGNSMGKVMSWGIAVIIMISVAVLAWESAGFSVADSKRLYKSVCVDILKTRLIRPSGLEISKISSFDVSGKGSVFISYSAPNRGGGFGAGAMSCAFSRQGHRSFLLTGAKLNGSEIWPSEAIIIWNDMSDRLEIGGGIILGFLERFKLLFWSV
jgi:hypothetical protein|tara:strand:+ start:399 stop:863 length:465 start_codon:yes stop_codon:yes gene_type:complete